MDKKNKSNIMQNNLIIEKLLPFDCSDIKTLTPFVLTQLITEGLRRGDYEEITETNQP